MTKHTKIYDSLHMGRSSIDLYANEIGAPFEEIKSFAAYVGGSPTNISVGGRRLGLRTSLLTGLGNDPVGDFVLHFLNKKGWKLALSDVNRATGPVRLLWALSRRTNSRLPFIVTIVPILNSVLTMCWHHQSVLSYFSICRDQSLQGAQPQCHNLCS